MTGAPIRGSGPPSQVAMVARMPAMAMPGSTPAACHGLRRGACWRRQSAGHPNWTTAHIAYPKSRPLAPASPGNFTANSGWLVPGHDGALLLVDASRLHHPDFLPRTDGDRTRFLWSLGLRHAGCGEDQIRCPRSGSDPTAGGVVPTPELPSGVRFENSPPAVVQHGDPAAPVVGMSQTPSSLGRQIPTSMRSRTGRR